MRMLALTRYALCDNGSRLLVEVFRAVKTLVYTSSGYNSLYKNVHWKTYDDCAILCASFIRDAKLNYDKCTVYLHLAWCVNNINNNNIDSRLGKAQPSVRGRSKKLVLGRGGGGGGGEEKKKKLVRCHEVGGIALTMCCKLKVRRLFSSLSREMLTFSRLIQHAIINLEIAIYTDKT